MSKRERRRLYSHYTGILARSMELIVPKCQQAQVRTIWSTIAPAYFFSDSNPSISGAESLQRPQPRALCQDDAAVCNPRDSCPRGMFRLNRERRSTTVPPTRAEPPTDLYQQDAVRSGTSPLSSQLGPCNAQSARRQLFRDGDGAVHAERCAGTCAQSDAYQDPSLKY